MDVNASRPERGGEPSGRGELCLYESVNCLPAPRTRHFLGELGGGFFSEPIRTELEEAENLGGDSSTASPAEPVVEVGQNLDGRIESPDQGRDEPAHASPIRAGIRRPDELHTIGDAFAFHLPCPDNMLQTFLHCLTGLP